MRRAPFSGPATSVHGTNPRLKNAVYNRAARVTGDTGRNLVPHYCGVRSEPVVLFRGATP